MSFFLLIKFPSVCIFKKSEARIKLFLELADGNSVDATISRRRGFSSLIASFREQARAEFVNFQLEKEEYISEGEKSFPAFR